MESPSDQERVAGSSQRAESIARAWFEAIEPVVFLADSADETRRILGELSQQLVNLLLADPFDAEPARQIGDALANTHLLQPDVLMKTQEVLASSLVHGLPADELFQLQTRTAALFGMLATGFFGRARDMILTEQEEIRRAQLTAHSRLEEAAQRSRERYETLVEGATQAIFIIDRHGRLQFANGSAAGELGGLPQELIGQTMWDLFPQDIADRQMESVLRVLTTGKPEVTESRTMLQGKHHWRETSLQPLKYAASEFDAVLGISADITERKLTETASKRYLDRLSLLHEIDRGILAANSPEAIAQAVLNHVGQLLPAWGAGVVLLELDAGEFVMLAGEIGPFTAGGRYPNIHWTIGDRLKAEEPFIIDDLRDTHSPNPDWQRLIALGGRCLLSIPLVVRGALIGVFAVISNRTGAYTEEDVEVARQIGASLAIAIQDAKLLEAERAARKENLALLEQINQHARELEGRVEERTQELVALYEITAIASSYLDVSKVLKHSLTTAIEVLHCQGGGIYLQPEDGNGLYLAAHSDHSGPSPGVPALESSGLAIAEQVLKHGKVIRESVEVTRSEEEQEDTTFKVLAVPMRARGRVLGVVELYAKPAQEFPPGDLNLMSAMADHMAAAVENARLQRNTERVAVMEERQRLARDLHDSVSQQMYSLMLFADAARECIIDGKTSLVPGHLQDIEATALQALKEMRLMLFELRSDALDEGLAEALRHRFEAVEARAGVTTRFSAAALPRLSEAVEESLFRIASEALNNALKHTNATEISIALVTEGGNLSMEIQDNGKGFDPQVAVDLGGMGLKIMHERSERMNGVLAISSEIGKGTSVRVTIDLDEANAPEQ